MMFLLAFYLFSLGKQFIDNWKEVKKHMKEIREANKHEHGVVVSWEMIYQLLKWLDNNHLYSTDDEDDDE